MRTILRENLSKRILVQIIALAALAVTVPAGRAAAVEPDFDNVALTPLTCGHDEPAGDESPSSLDFVGTDQYPAAQVGHDADFLYFRYRVDGNASGPQGFDQWAWVALLQVPNGDPFQYQYAVGLNGDGATDDFGNNGDTVEIWQNTEASDIDFSPVFHDVSEVRLFSQKYSFVSPETANTGPIARVVPTGDGSDFGGNPDYFVDFAVPVAELLDHGVIASAAELDDLLYFPAVSTNMSNFNKGYLNGCPFLPNTDLEVGKVVTPETVPAGDPSPVTYTITVRNAGLVLGKGVVIEDAAFPPYFALGSVNVTTDDPMAVATVESTDPLIVRTPLLPKNATITVEVNGTAAPTCDSDPFVNTVEAHASNAMNETATATLSVGAGSAESCDGVDNDCDGQVDEGGGTLCADGNACTADACMDGSCSNVVSDPGCVPCSTDGDCNDGNACTADACTAGVCSSTVTDPNCRPCETAGDCNDGNACTTDACEAGVCSSVAADPNCVPCATDGDCNDANACTTDACVEGICGFTPTEPGCVPCTTDGDCNDANACTTDACSEGICAFTVTDPNCRPCETAGDCNDANACTTDACTEGVCSSVASDPNCVPCATDGDCNDANACTTDACSEGVCAFTVTDPNCRPCTADGDCNDANACTTDTCAEGICSSVASDPTCVPCATDGDCNDANACTEDACVEGICGFTVTDPTCVPCATDDDCDDANACTTDACSEGTCAFVADDPGCVPCTSDLECSDGNGCTTDSCTEGVCASVQPDPTCVPCATAEQCNDGQVCTDDTCNAQGVCENPAKAGCIPCEVDDDCADSDACTADTCGEDGSCQFNTIPGCIPCESDEQCADTNECTEDSCFMGACANVPIEGCEVCVPVAEVCGDGQDNDCDELTDCDDPNCAESPQCVGNEEICGDCIDNDGDSFVDLDDPDCCALSQSIPMKKLRIKTPVQIKRKRLKVKARYAPALPSENFDPLTQDTGFQMSDENGMVFCATLPADFWTLRNRKRTIFRFKSRHGEVSNGLSLGTYRQKKKGQVIFRTRGKKVDLDIREFSGEVRATVRLGDQCSFATAELRTGKNALIFP